MTFEIRSGRYVARIFYCELRVLKVPGNMMGWIFRDGENGPWRLQYRMRYVVDDDLTYKSQDRKSWYEATGKPGATLEALLPGTRTIFEAAGGGEYHEVIVDSDDAEVVARRLFEQPWCHRETITPEEWDARQTKRG